MTSGLGEMSEGPGGRWAAAVALVLISGAPPPPQLANKGTVSSRPLSRSVRIEGTWKCQ